MNRIDIPTTDRLRTAVRESPLTPYAIAKASGVDQSILSRWLAGTRGITLETADKIAAAIGYRLSVVAVGD